MIPSWIKTFDNPVLLKEMRVGFREKKVFYALISWVVVVALVAAVISMGAFDNDQEIDRLPETGIFFMEFLFWVQLVLLAMLAPSLTTSAVSGERERKSFEMLLTTHLSPPELVLGKFGFAASFIMLALCSTVPLEAIVFFLGGVSLKSFLLSKLILALFGFLCALYGLMMSARESRSAYATGQTYLGMVFFGWFALVGLGGLRYAPDIPLIVYVGAVIGVIYLCLFLFWKAVNHLEDRAKHIKIILAIGLVFYILVLGMTLLAQYLVPALDDSIWALSGPVHYLLFGILLNPMRPATKVERARFAQSRLSRPFTWILILILGSTLPLAACNEDKAIAICLYGMFAGLATAWFCRSLSLRQPWRYPQLLGGAWLLLNVVPVFSLVQKLNESNQDWHPATVSPIVMLDAYADHAPNYLPTLALLFYLTLFIGGTLLHRRWERKHPAG